jgi:hypothetical protein
MKRAYAVYRPAVRKRLGVLVSALGRSSSGETLTYIYGPRDPDEAEHLMYPDGLKLNVPTSPWTVVPVGQLTWTLLRPLRRRHSAERLK